MSQNTNLVYYTRLQWSKDYSTKDLTEYMLGCDMVITTRQLTVVTLSDDREQLQELIWNLLKEGMENKEISNYLNLRNIYLEEQKRFQENLFGVYWKDTVQEKRRRKNLGSNILVSIKELLKKNSYEEKSDFWSKTWSMNRNAKI